MSMFFKTFFWLQFAGNGGTQAPILVYPNDIDGGVPKISLPTFAMASYKLKGSIWTQNGVSESQVVNSLLQAADNWLRLLQVNHPDYQFFVSHGTYHRWIKWDALNFCVHCSLQTWYGPSIHQSINPSIETDDGVGISNVDSCYSLHKQHKRWACLKWRMK